MYTYINNSQITSAVVFMNTVYEKLNKYVF